MKKSILFVLLAMILAFAGCQDSVPVNTPGTTNAPEGTEKEQPVTGADSTEAPDTTKDTEPTATPEPKEVEPKLYDRLAAWDEFYKEYSCYYSAIQIEDMFLYPGMLGSELAKMVATSEDTAITPVSVDKLFDPDVEEYIYDTQKVTYYRNETPWFDVYVRNYSEDLLPFGECIISLVVPCEDVMEYCRFFDGTYSLSSIKEITYKDYDKLVASLENTGYSVEKDGSTWRLKSTEDFCPASLSEEVLYWTSHDIWMDMKIDSDTGCVTEMAPWERALDYSECKLYTAPIPEDYDWSKPECETRLNGIDVSRDRWYLNEPDDMLKAEVVSVHSIGEADFAFVYRMKDGETGELVYYKVCDLYDMKIDWAGNIIVPESATWIDRTSVYVSSLGFIEKEFGKKSEVKLLYEYDKNLVKEIKTINSFADITVEHVQQLTEMAMYNAEKNVREIEQIVDKRLFHMTFTNVDKIAGELTHDSNVFWVVIQFSRANGEAQFVEVDVYNPRIALETNEIIWDSDTIFYASKSYSDPYRLLEDVGLSGTADENPWVTEAMPLDLYDEVRNKYKYNLWNQSLDK
ncbi:MAG: hypothetical protein J6J38_08080 [Lachnospiraceae bacterium]|nr:hypothetical protein [Lachnospiraceae bacterium]